MVPDVRAVVQRVSRASVTVDGEELTSIGRGLLVLVGIAENDEKADAEWIARKCARLRVFEDGGGSMNLSLADIDGQMLVVSQFTLMGDARKGRRPSFSHAMPPDDARQMYEQVVLPQFEAACPGVRSGRFQADMEVALVNDGPVTLLLDSKRAF